MIRKYLGYCFFPVFLLVALSVGCVASDRDEAVENNTEVTSENSIKVSSENSMDAISEDLDSETINNALNDQEDNKMGLARFNFSEKKNAGKISATKEFFENLDKNTKKEYIEEEVGSPDGMAGSGVHYDIWDLEDGYSAWVHFSYKDQKIETITIQDSEGKGEMIYSR